MKVIRVLFLLTFALLLFFVGMTLGLLWGMPIVPTYHAPGRIFPEKMYVHTYADKHKWRYVQFRIYHKPGTYEWRPYIDTAIADQVLAPVLAEYKMRISLWRIHRRSTKEPPGHQFSLIYFTDDVTAKLVRNDIKKHPFLRLLKKEKLLKKVVFVNKSAKLLVGDTSDKSWSQVTQEVWPQFAQGASVAWMQAVRKYAEEKCTLKRAQKNSDVLECYVEVDAILRNSWANEGKHAFIHHLSAIYGYPPMLMWF